MTESSTSIATRAGWLQPLRARWQTLSAREQSLLRALALVLLLALLWRVVVSPPLHSLRDHEARRAALATAQAQMQVWQAQAQAVQQQVRPNPAEAVTVLQTLTAANGPGWQLQVQGERATVQVQNATPEALAQWLLQAREQAQSLPVQAQLERSDVKSGGSSGPRWRGRLVLALPKAGPP